LRLSKISMITTSQLGNWGNLGNQMFLIAAVSGISRKNGQDYFFPEWKYENWFETELPHGNVDDSFTLVREKQFHVYDWHLENGNFDLKGWLQSEKYFDIQQTKKTFVFKKEIVAKVVEQHGYLFNREAIVISVRRGDFVNNPLYFQLSYRYYLLALFENFPDWQQYNLIFTSDDIGYCKQHFSFLPNAYFLENVAPMEQLIIGQQCTHFIISNSTFSWWLAWLGEKPTSKIVRPMRNFRGKFAEENNDCDFFPERWKAFDDGKFKFKNHRILKIRAVLYNFKTDSRFYFKKYLNLLKKQVKNVIGKR